MQTFSLIQLGEKLNLCLVFLAKNNGEEPETREKLSWKGTSGQWNRPFIRRTINTQLNSSLRLADDKQRVLLGLLSQTFQPSRFDRETHGLGCQFTALPLNLTVNQKALKLPNNSGRYYLTHIFDVSRFEVLISRFIWAFFQNLQIWM